VCRKIDKISSIRVQTIEKHYAQRELRTDGGDVDLATEALHRHLEWLRRSIC